MLIVLQVGNGKCKEVVNFLTYLKKWEVSVANNEKIPKAAKPFCTLPQQTVEGLKMCGKSHDIE